jgi:RNA polymerase sigma-70 factor (ECF subfamily)
VLVYLDALYQTALRLTHSRADAEDIVQETCVRAWKSFDRFNPGTNARAWLYTILRNVFLNHLRQKGRQPLEDDEMTWAIEADHMGAETLPVANPEEQFFQSVLHGDIDRALKTLPLMFREAVVLADLQGLSYREIAEVLACPVGTVMSRLSRGRALLRITLAQAARAHGYAPESPP